MGAKCLHVPGLKRQTSAEFQSLVLHASIMLIFLTMYFRQMKDFILTKTCYEPWLEALSFFLFSLWYLSLFFQSSINSAPIQFSPSCPLMPGIIFRVERVQSSSGDTAHGNQNF